MTATLPAPVPAPAIRRRPTSVRASRPAALAAVPANEWNALRSPGSAPLAHGYLCAWESSELAGLQSRPILAYASGAEHPIAACPGYSYDLDVAAVRSPQAERMMRWPRRIWPRAGILRAYELGCGTPLTNPFLVENVRLLAAVVPILLKAALEEADRLDASFVLVQSFASRTGAVADQLSQLGFVAVPMPPTAVLALPYDSFDEYLRAMRASYRRRARRALQRTSELSIEHRTGFAELAGELARLWRAVYDRATELKREALTVSFFEGISELEETSVLLVRRRDGSIACFALLLDDRPWLTFVYCGFEASAGRGEGAYFRLLYEIVRLAIEHRYEQVDLGMTTLTPKFDLGAVPVPLFGWFRHRNRLVQRTLSALGRGPLRPESPQPRHVFKCAPATAAELMRARDLCH
jgi:predicted N-acyltransferase